MTLHTAKGLEFPVVFLTGMEDGVFPHMRALGQAKELEEERRLAYVGITRARERLYLTRSSLRSAWGQPSYNPPSRFLEEIPAQHVDWKRTGRHRAGRPPARRPAWRPRCRRPARARRRRARPASPRAGPRRSRWSRWRSATGSPTTSSDSARSSAVKGTGGERRGDGRLRRGEAEAAAAAVRAGGEAVAERARPEVPWGLPRRRGRLRLTSGPGRGCAATAAGRSPSRRPGRTSKCRCGPVELPEFPEYAIGSPAFTVVPEETR